MKICAVICEYNPFHNGHLYQLNEAKHLSGADAVLCIMSGNFVQRGEAAVADKFTRAKHAVWGGADVVIELPTIFATSNAELFAKGAISILSSIPAVTTLCFGVEMNDKAALLQAATLLNKEPQEISQKIKALTAEGMSYAKARATAWQDLLPTEILTSPNNILGLEYTRAILEQNANIDILPIKRLGGGYNDTALNEPFSSASAIRAAISTKENVKNALPDFVLGDLPQALTDKLDCLEKYALLSRAEEEIAKVCDCTEGLENAFKKAALLDAPLVESLTSARYTSARIRRIALQNLLKIDETLIRQSLQSSLYLRVLAVKKSSIDALSALSAANLPIIARAHDEEVLSDTAKLAFEVDRFAERIYNLLYPSLNNRTIFV
ncbi:MAG: nucleotidyltransferase family protein [Clostridia bacterium]|nr:nucleotidyltransferase family protein [Clostridia bacterium]